MAPTVIQSKRDKPLLVNEGFVYHHHSYNKDRTRKYWRCERRQTCNARCVTNTNMEELVVYKCDISTHLHLPDHAAVEAMQIVQNIRELAAEQPYARPSDVIRTGVGNVEEEVSVKLPEENHLKRMVNRRQNKERPRLPGPNTVNFEITAPYDRTRSDQLFLLYDSGREGANRTLIFSTSENLRILAASDTLLTDGTILKLYRGNSFNCTLCTESFWTLSSHLFLF